ncbi:uncharacterized protein LOC132067835 [Lycium ferocissimum]|uniref:uncharacterized protein LOC132067835 n=1 Tax=Lycium ferocissimum TaxID=112874 RepID=UPI002814ECFB|nr:uncharacterized protein LOC132067835 [Lycium ferocissimum]
MAFKANVLLVFSLVLLIISSEVNARDMVEPSLPLLEANEVQNTGEMSNPTVMKSGWGKFDFVYNAACFACECPKKGNDDDNNKDNNNNNNSGNVSEYCKAICC